jgi:hypothetical protein
VLTKTGIWDQFHQGFGKGLGIRIGLERLSIKSALKVSKQVERLIKFQLIGFNWSLSDIDRYGNVSEEDFDDRICVLLVKGDRHARWLALGGVISQKRWDSPGRQVLLWTEAYCVNCAIETASQFPHQWLVIL